jgi:3-oxosteroid 1-dehydrogenase
MKRTVEADVVVAGSGGAALTTALTAAAHGARTLVIEKTGYLGGTSAYSGAGLWLPGNHVLAAAGVADSTEAGLRYLRALVGDRTPAPLQETFVRTAPELARFLDEQPALEFGYLPFPDYFDAPGRMDTGRDITPRALRGDRLGPWRDLVRPPIAVDQYGSGEASPRLSGGQALIGRLLLALDATGRAEVRTRTRMTELILTGGRVTGVVARDGDGELAITARLGVMLAAGGFEADPGLRQRWHGLPGADWTSAAPGSNTGDALRAAQAAGAATDLLDQAWWCPAVLFPNGRAAFTLGLSGGIIVSARGERFANESLPYDRMGRAILAARQRGAGEAPFWWVFDSRSEAPPGISQPMPDRESFAAAGRWHSAATTGELAGRLGVPAGALAATVARFNGFAATGKDLDFGRGEDAYDRFFASGTGPNPCLVPLDCAPFHAVQIVLGDLGTKGGAVTDGDGRVLRADGTPIPGLFAAGNSAASVTGHVYPGPGVPLGSGMVFGYRAARLMCGAGTPRPAAAAE